MTGLTQGKQGDDGCFSVLSSYLKSRKGKKRDATQDSPGPLPPPEPLLANVAVSPPAASQEPIAAIHHEPLESLDSNLWSRAYRGLDDKTRKWIDEASADKCGEEKTQDLVKIVKEREAEYKSASPKLKIGGFEIKWRDYAGGVVRWVTEIGDITMAFAPAQSPVIWSALKILLKANVSQCEDLAAIFGCAEEVLRLTRHGKVYEIAYLSGDSCNAATQNLQDALVDLYKSLLELLAHAFTRLNEGQGKQILRALVSGGQGAKLISQLGEQEHKVSITAHACGAVASQEHQRLLKSLDEPLRNVGDTVKKLGDKIDKSAMIEALEYISKIPIGEHQQEKRDSRTPTTCNWLLKHPKFLEWEGSDCSSTLWLQGNVGAGKSFLTSKVIDHLSATCQQETEYEEGLAYFFCSRSDPMRQETKYILRSYISQLARVPNNSNMMEKNIHKLYLKAKQEQRGFSTAECETALTGLVNFYRRTTFVLDALDECEVESREALARILRNLVDVGEGTVKVFIASRKEDDIEEYLGLQKLIAISTADNHNDIEKYIESEVDKVGGVWRSVSTEVKEQVKRTIAEKSDGMFRWAYLQWQQLKKLKTNETIRERLGKLPKSLTEAYDEIYSQAEEKVVLQRAVKWVLCAAEPLTSEVLLAAVRLGSNFQPLALPDPIYESTSESNLPSLTLIDPIDESTLESICSHLIVLDPRLKVWKFPHASVAEYFEDHHKGWISRAAEAVAILLVSCLIDCYSEWTPPELEYEAREFLRDTPDLDNYLDPRHPLQKYADLYWTHHAQNTANQCQEAPGLAEILKRFLGTKGPQQVSSQQYQTWCKLLGIRPETRSAHYWHSEDVQPSEYSIFGICVYGLHRLLKGWWDKDIDVSQVNGSSLDLLTIAARYGHESLCSELIARGGDIHKELDTSPGSAFKEAIKCSQIEVMRLFLKEGVDPNLAAMDESPLCVAAAYGGVDVVTTLLDAGADPNIVCRHCNCGGALTTAAFKGDIDTVEALLEHKADANCVADRDHQFGSPLAAAAWGGSPECAGFLVENGAEVCAVGRRIWKCFGCCDIGVRTSQDG
ncbi:hypothetical protein V8C26DRAFT_408415 [Trichoderma gracile]